MIDRPVGGFVPKARTNVTRIAIAAASLLAAGACAGRPAGVVASGTVEMAEIDVASMVGGRILELRVDEGDSVHAGDTLAVLSRGEIAAELQSQSAQADRAAAQLEDLKAGPRHAELAAARSELAAATAQAAFATTDFDRVKPLYDQQVASASDFDRARSARDAAEAGRNAAASQVRLLEAGTRTGQIEAAARAVESARAQTLAARARAGELVLTAPSAGVVLLRNFEPGELVPPNLPVVTLGNPERLWVRCYVAEPLLPRVRLGARAEITVDGVKRPFGGRVAEISTRAEFTPRAALTEDERANLVFGVKVDADATGGVLKPGLPATVRILDSGR